MDVETLRLVLRVLERHDECEQGCMSCRGPVYGGGTCRTVQQHEDDCEWLAAVKAVREALPPDSR